MTQKNPTDTYPTTDVSASPDAAITPSFWLLKEGTAQKLGARAEGGIRYHIISDPERQHLFVAIAANESGGYFSRERVPFEKIEACLDSIPIGKSCPSKALKDSFVGRSSNNAGFLVAILRNEGLLVAAPDAEAHHVRHGDTEIWKHAMFSETGTLIAPAVENGGKKQVECEPVPDHSEHKKTLTIRRKK